MKHSIFPLFKKNTFTLLLLILIFTAATACTALPGSSKNRESEKWISGLTAAQDTNQLIIVAADGSLATVSMHTKSEDGIWEEIYKTSGKIGKNGIGKTKEGDGKTPTGIFQFTKAFGISEDPGISAMAYQQLDESHHWVDDSDSRYYNQFVSDTEVEKDWNSSEHLYTITPQYQHALALDYNASCTPYLGSAVFLHCFSADFETTSGCIAIPKEDMILTMQELEKNCKIIIDSEENVAGY